MAIVFMTPLSRGRELDVRRRRQRPERSYARAPQPVLDATWREDSRVAERPRISRQGLNRGDSKGRFRTGTLASLMPQISVPVGRNDPCPCGSGRKHKQCCLAKDETAAAAARAKAAEEAAVLAPEAEPVTTASTRAPKPRTEQPWRAKTARGFVPRLRTPRKVGGSLSSDDHARRQILEGSHRAC